MYCHKCGAQSVPGQQFCPQCGTKLLTTDGTAWHPASPPTTPIPTMGPGAGPEYATASMPVQSTTASQQARPGQSVHSGFRLATTQFTTRTAAIIAGSIVGAAIIGIVGIGFWTARQHSFQSAIDACESHFDSEHWEYYVEDNNNMFRIGDNGKTLTVTTISSNYDIASCVFGQLDMPDSVRTKISHTRPIDGTQTDKWDDITATWTYSDNELTVILEK